LNPIVRWPLNQNGAPAASLTPDTVPLSGVKMGSFLVRRPGRSTVWKPDGTKRTVSPTWIVTRCGKKSLTSPAELWNAFCEATGTPMSTVFVAACAAAGAAAAKARASAAPTALRTREVMRAPSCRAQPPRRAIRRPYPRAARPLKYQFRPFRVGARQAAVYLTPRLGRRDARRPWRSSSRTWRSAS
jgi:hypothetical protein